MPSETIVAMFRTAANAEAAASELRASGINPSAIEQHTSEQVHHDNNAAMSDATAGEKRSGLWGWIMGDETSSDEAAMYDRKLADGSVMLTVIVADTDAARVESIIDKHHPVDVDDRDATTMTATQSATNTSHVATPAADRPAVSATAAAGQVIGLAEESLEVGKRVVDRGTAKIRRYVVARPVEEQIRLRTESLRMERRPVTGDGKVGADAFSEKTFEMSQTSEEAVVTKKARIVEDVVIGKDVSERVETVKDTVRREEIEVVDAHGKGVAARPAVSTTAGTPVAPKTPMPATQH